MLGAQRLVQHGEVGRVQAHGGGAAVGGQHVQRLAHHGQQGLGLAAQLLADHLARDVAGQVQQFLRRIRLQLLEAGVQAGQQRVHALRRLSARAGDIVIHVLLPLLPGFLAALLQALGMAFGACLLQQFMQPLLVHGGVDAAVPGVSASTSSTMESASSRGASERPGSDRLWKPDEEAGVRAMPAPPGAACASGAP